MPHPFFFNQLRTVTGGNRASAAETGARQALWMIPAATADWVFGGRRISVGNRHRRARDETYPLRHRDCDGHGGAVTTPSGSAPGSMGRICSISIGVGSRLCSRPNDL